jgi:hypothetical protein
MPGLTNYARNKIIDWWDRGQAFSPPATKYYTLVSTTPSAAVAGTPLSGTGYARVGVAATMAAWAGTQAGGSTTASTGTTGVTSNNAVIDFGTALADWGTATYWESYDALTGGNRLEFGVIVDGLGTPTPRTIVTGDPVSFPIGALRKGLS